MAVLCLAPAALAQSSVTGIYPLTPLREGSASVDLAFDVKGDVQQLSIDVSGTATGTGSFVQLSNVVIQRDAASTVPFHALLPLSGAFPSGAQLQVAATPIQADGTRGQTRSLLFDATASSALTKSDPPALMKTGPG